MVEKKNPYGLENFTYPELVQMLAAYEESPYPNSGMPMAALQKQAASFWEKRGRRFGIGAMPTYYPELVRSELARLIKMQHQEYGAGVAPDMDSFKPDTLQNISLQPQPPRPVAQRPGIRYNGMSLGGQQPQEGLQLRGGQAYGANGLTSRGQYDRQLASLSPRQPETGIFVNGKAWRPGMATGAYYDPNAPVGRMPEGTPIQDLAYKGEQTGGDYGALLAQMRRMAPFAAGTSKQRAAATRGRTFDERKIDRAMKMEQAKADIETREYEKQLNIAKRLSEKADTPAGLSAAEQARLKAAESYLTNKAAAMGRAEVEEPLSRAKEDRAFDRQVQMLELGAKADVEKLNAMEPVRAYFSALQGNAAEMVKFNTQVLDPVWNKIKLQYSKQLDTLIKAPTKEISEKAEGAFRESLGAYLMFLRATGKPIDDAAISKWVEKRITGQSKWLGLSATPPQPPQY